MRYLLPSIENNPSITQTREVFEVCNSLFKKTDIDYFAYTRIFSNKTYFALSSNPGWVKNFYYNQYPSGGYNGKPIQSGTYFTQNICNIGCTKKMIEDMQEKYHLWNPIFFVKVYDHYWDVFIFSMPRVPYDSINFYLHNLDVLENFNTYFKEQAETIISRACKDKIIIPKQFHETFAIHENKLPQKINICLPNYYQQNALLYINQMTKTKLTDQEIKCLNLLMIGQTYKMIGQTLGRSHRTIETHINNLKNKLNVQTKAQLISLAFQACKFS